MKNLVKIRAIFAVAAILYECVRSEGGWRAWQDAAKKRKEMSPAEKISPNPTT